MRKQKLSKGIVLITSIVVISIIAVIIIGLCMPEQEEVIQGSAETTDYRISSKVPSRVLEIKVKEGDMVRKGDTLVVLEAPEIQAKLQQANAALTATEALDKKANKGARAEEIQGAYEILQKAKAGREVAEKTYNRIERLFENGVMAEQKRDEAKAQYDAMVASEKAAQSQYEMAVKGARDEDKQAAAAQVNRAKGAVKEVSSYISETILTATEDGQIEEIYPEIGELVGTGAPIVNVSVVNDVWFVFNIREDKLPQVTVGKVVDVYVPAINKDVPVKITRIKNVGNFAAWKATKALDGFDLKVFEVKAVPTQKVDGVCPGMSAILKQ